jgi:uncharacterized protein
MQSRSGSEGKPMSTALPQVAPHPINSIVMKVVAGCNLNCSYCYEYNMGDDSWKRKPPSISDDIVRLTGRRIREHARAHALERFGVSLHGGEPLLLGAQRLAEIAAMLRDAVGDAVPLDFGMQTNGTLLDEAGVRALADAEITIGVSLDGTDSTNDAYRVDKRGRGTHAAAVRGIETVRSVAPRFFGGILCVINVASDSRSTFEHLVGFQPPMIDFLLPHGSWDRMPHWKESSSDTRYGRWLTDAFDAWFDGPHQSVSVRYFESIMAGLMGGGSTTEAIGPGPVTLVTVATDGAIEGVDTMKSVFPGAQDLGIGLSLATLDQARNIEHVRMRQIGIDALADECRQCPIVRTCGGGYFPHRFGRGRGFANPSVYCEDIKFLTEHIRRRICVAVRGR